MATRNPHTAPVGVPVSGAARAAQRGDLDPVRTRRLLVDAAERGAAYLAGLDDRGVAPTADAVAALAALDEPLPAASCEPEEVVAQLDALVSPATAAMAGRRYFGFVIGGSLPVAVAANALATAWDQNSASHLVTPGTAELERIALIWLQDLLGLPAGVGGAFVTGATMANTVALAAARHAVLAEAGWDVESDGLFGAPPVRVVVGGEVHPSASKALSFLGFGKERVEVAEADGQGRFRADRLPALEGPSIVVLQAGNVNSGAFDPFADIVPRARDAGAWVHVDGAFGLWAGVSPALRGLTAGLEQADSWATDFHKWLNVPYDSGVAFVRDPAHLNRAMSLTAAYLPEPGVRDPSSFTPELSRRARGVEVWAALKRLGADGVQELVERCCRHARRFAEGLSEAGFEVLNDVVLNQVLVSFGSPERTREVIAALQDDGTCWCGGTVWQGRTAMRISLSSWATTDEDVERCLDVMVRLARATAD